MYDVMQGVRVIEVAEHTFVPAAAMILADWGADVIKIERVVGGGDAARSMRAIQRPGLKSNPYFEAANRGKRGLGLDLTKAEGREYLYQLIESADVFITNMRDDACIKLGITAADVQQINPKIVYASGTGYGRRGPLSAARGFDMPSSWTRSGSAFVQAPANGGPPPSQPGSVGDLTGGATLAGAICAALFRRERTGKGAIVDHALYQMGTYIMSQALIQASMGWKAAGPMPAREAMPDPMLNWYKTSDNRWLLLCLLYEAWWEDFATKVGRPEWITDPKFVDSAARAANCVEMIAQLDSIFASQTLAEWEAQFAELEGVWSPAKSPEEVIADPQALENGFVTPVTYPDGDHYLTGASPAQFDGRPVGELKASPTHGEHTDDVMRELGLTDEQITELKSRGIVI